MTVWKKYVVTLCIYLSLFFMTGCVQQEEEPTERIGLDDQDAFPSVIAPSVQVAEQYYRGLHPFKPSQTRGTLYSSLANYRLDADRLELGLLEIAQEYVSIEDHLFREGQIIEPNELREWLRVESETNRLGLNPADLPQPVLLHILEHNYWDVKGEELKAIVIGLSLASTYEVERREGETAEKVTMRYTPDELRNFGQVMADKIAERIRLKVNSVPIIIALYQLEEKNSLVPGNFLSVGYVEREQNYVSQWKTIDELYLLFPSNALTRFSQERSLSYARDFADFKQEVQDFFPNYLGIIGLGRFIDEELVELTLTVTTEFASKTEVIQLTQFLGATAIDLFPEHIQLNIYVQAINKPQAVFIRPAKGEAVMHVYR